MFFATMLQDFIPKMIYDKNMEEISRLLVRRLIPKEKMIPIQNRRKKTCLEFAFPIVNMLCV